MTLPPEVEMEFEEELQAFEKEKNMPYVTAIERHGVEKGMRQGMQQGKAILLERLLTKRFGPLSESVRTRLSNASVEELDRWAERVLDAPTLDAVWGD